MICDMICDMLVRDGCREEAWCKDAGLDAPGCFAVSLRAASTWLERRLVRVSTLLERVRMS